MTSDDPTFDRERTFKPENYLPLYRDGTYDPPESETQALENSRADAAYIDETLGLSPGERVLDLACGHGRIANLLGGEYDVHGLDISADLLDIARENAPSPADATPAYVRGDMRTLPYADNSFDAIYNVFNSFGYFDDETNGAIVGEIARVLDEDGRLLMEIVDRDNVVRTLSDSRVYHMDDLFVADELTFDPETGRQIVDRVVAREDGIEQFQYVLRLYSVTEIRSLLERHGLKMVNLDGDLRGSEYSIETKSISLLARPA